MRRATAVCIGNGIAEVISIHALREESDTGLVGVKQRVEVFQSTPSARRATAADAAEAQKREISIHALREESDFVRVCACAYMRISIHALREESDSP